MKMSGLMKDDKGAVAVEFAMVASVFLASLLGIVEVGRAYWTYNTLQYAVEATARYYLTHTGATNSELAAYAAGQMGANISVSPLSVTVTKSTVSGIHEVEVDAAYTYGTLVPTMTSAWSSVVLHAKTQLPTS